MSKSATCRLRRCWCWQTSRKPNRVADNYAPNDRGVQVKDDLVINNYVNQTGKANYHKMYGYLSAPELSEVVRSFL